MIVVTKSNKLTSKMMVCLLIKNKCHILLSLIYYSIFSTYLGGLVKISESKFIL